MSFLELTDVQKRFGDFAAVENFNLAAERGEFVSFLGPSGCGKTTTLRMIAGFEQPTAGTIVVDGKDITHRPPNRRNVGMVFQSYALFPNMTVADNIGFGLRVRKTPKDRDPDEGRRAAGADQPARQGRPLPVPAVGRPAAAGRAGPGARDRAPGAPARRAAVGPRREDPGRAAQGDPGDPAPARDHDRLRDPRPGGGAVAVGPGRRDERGPDRADRHAGRDLQLPGDAVRGLVRRDAQPHRRRRSSTPARGRLSIDGQEVRAAKADRRRVASGTAVTLALRPESVELGEGGGSNRLRGTVEDVELPRLDRPDPGRARARAIALVSLDTFNDPTCGLPEIDEVVTVSFPPEACLVIGAGPAPEIDVVAEE